MTSPLYFQKVLSLPDTFSPNTIYLVKPDSSTEYIEFYISGKGGNSIFKLPDVNTINNLINNQFLIVSTYEQLLNTNVTNTDMVSIAWVLDTSGDVNTNGLPAPYIYVPNLTTNVGQWYCLFNIQYLENNVDWNWIINGPVSTPSEIDQVVFWWKANNVMLGDIENSWNEIEEDVSVLNYFYDQYSGELINIVNYFDSNSSLFPYGNDLFYLYGNQQLSY